MITLLAFSINSSDESANTTSSELLLLNADKVQFYYPAQQSSSSRVNLRSPTVWTQSRLVLEKHCSPNLPQRNGDQETTLDSRCGLSQEGVFVESVCRVAVEGARLHWDALNITVGLLGQVERLEHPEAWNTSRSGVLDVWLRNSGQISPK